MDTIKSPYLDGEALELEVLYEENESYTKQPYSPYLNGQVFDEYEIEDEWDETTEIQNIEDEESFYEEENPYNIFEDEYDESELKEVESMFNEKECSCNDNEFEVEFDASDEGLLHKFEDEHYDEMEYDDFVEDEDIDEYLDNEFYDYEDVEEELKGEFYNYEDAELEEAFFSNLKKHFDRWNQKKNSANPTPSLPPKSHSGKDLKLPIVSVPIYQIGTLYKVNSAEKKKNYGIPETIEALKWIINEFNKKSYSTKVTIHIGDISQLGGGKIGGHRSHRMGIDVDVSLYVDGKRVQVGREEPPRGKTRKLIPYKRYLEQRKYVKEFIKIVIRNPKLRIKTIGFRDHQLIKDFPGIVSNWVGHIKHLHLRFCLPDHRKSELSINKVYGRDEIKPNYKCNKRAPKSSKTEPQSINIQDAIKYNKQKKHSLGWEKHLKLIQIYLGYPIYTPDDSQFTRAVAIWQKKNGFKDDGKLGPQTWNKMKSVLGISNKNTTGASTNIDDLDKSQNLDQDKAKPLGKLIYTGKPLRTSRGMAQLKPYSFTSDDLVWFARLLEGEAGAGKEIDLLAVAFTMLNKYALFMNIYDSTFHQFIRRYSTTLQPVLNNKGAAARHYRSANYVKLSPREYYPINDKPKGKKIPKGQIQRHLNLQKRKWNIFNVRIRRIAFGVLSGQIKNPGFGLATEFASTRIYWKQNYWRRNGEHLKGNSWRDARKPTMKEWIQYTRSYAKIKKWQWIGDVVLGLDQFKNNAFFIDNRVANLPKDSVKIV